MATAQRPIGAFIFDLFGVVIEFDNDIVYRRLSQHCTDPEASFNALNGVMSAREVITGKLTLEQLYTSLVEAHGLSLDYKGFEWAWLEPYSKPMPGMAALIKDLSEHHSMVLLSNVDGYYWAAIRPNHPELDCFDKLIVSCEVAMAKPDPEIFLVASEAAGCEPGRCFFVDDTAVNIPAAQEMGFQTHLFRDVGALRRELKTLGLPGPRLDHPPT